MKNHRAEPSIRVMFGSRLIRHFGNDSPRLVSVSLHDRLYNAVKVSAYLWLVTDTKEFYESCDGSLCGLLKCFSGLQC